MTSILFDIIDKFRLRHSTLANIAKDIETTGGAVELKSKTHIEPITCYVTLTSVDSYNFGFAVEYSKERDEYIIYTDNVYVYHDKYAADAGVAKSNYSFYIDRNGLTEFVVSAINVLTTKFAEIRLGTTGE